MKTMILLFALCFAVASCGVRGDPEAPPNFTQTQ
ncbi:MAG: lipoprotein [Aestuariivirga sp.]